MAPEFSGVWDYCGSVNVVDQSALEYLPIIVLLRKTCSSYYSCCHRPAGVSVLAGLVSRSDGVSPVMVKQGFELVMFNSHVYTACHPCWEVAVCCPCCRFGLACRLCGAGASSWPNWASNRWWGSDQSVVRMSLRTRLTCDLQLLVGHRVGLVQSGSVSGADQSVVRINQRTRLRRGLQTRFWHGMELVHSNCDD